MIDHTAMHADLFETFGVDATVVRGAAAAVPVRAIVKHGVQQFGEYGQVIGRATTVDFQLAQWTPEQGDVVAWTDHLGMHSRTVARPGEADDYVAVAVLRG